MFRQAAFALVGALTFLTTAAQAQQPGHDYPPLAEIDGWVRDNYLDHRFDYLDFASGNSGRPVRVEGHKIEIGYAPNDPSTASALEVERTLLQQLSSVNAQVIQKEVVAVMKTEPALKLEVDGHTDAIGANSYNQKLSEERAKTVVANLVADGIASARLTAAGFGASKPIADMLPAKAEPKTGASN